MRVDVIATKNTPSNLGSRSSHARCHCARPVMSPDHDSGCGRAHAGIGRECRRLSSPMTASRARHPSLGCRMTLLTDRETLTHLNEAYIRASLNADAAWFDRHLAEDFICISHDATWYDKPTFLAMIAAG